MNKRDIEVLFRYTDWANARMLKRGRSSVARTIHGRSPRAAGQPPRCAGPHTGRLGNLAPSLAR